MKKIHFPFAVLVALMFCVAIVHAQIIVADVTPEVSHEGFPSPIPQPGLWQIRNGDASSKRIELGPVMGFVNNSYTSPLDGVTTSWQVRDSWTYEGEMFMEMGQTYTFATYIDDHATIDIDGNNILTQPYLGFGTGSYVCPYTGWHPISIRVWDTGGAYGYRYEFSPGIAYNVTGQTNQNPVTGWNQLIDPGDTSLFRASRICLAARMRENDPTIMDVNYIVYTHPDTTQQVTVRALAFENGERSFAKVIRPETFVDGTGANLGNGIAANVEHTVSWRVSADWAVDLAKVSFEILVSDEGQLPLELVTIPTAGTNAEMTINVRRPREDDLFNALLWHYADHAEDLTVLNGALKQGNTTLASGSALANSSAACGYVYGKMGFDLLSGSALSYARSATRWPLATTTKCQYGVLRASGE